MADELVIIGENDGLLYRSVKFQKDILVSSNLPKKQRKRSGLKKNRGTLFH